MTPTRHISYYVNAVMCRILADDARQHCRTRCKGIRKARKAAGRIARCADTPPASIFQSNNACNEPERIKSCPHDLILIL